MRNFGVIIASHGLFSVESLKVVEMIAGKQINVDTVALEEGESLEQFREDFNTKYNHLKNKEDVEFIIVFADIFGGTPFNTINRAIYEGNEMLAYAGYSLPVLLEVLTNDKLTKEKAIELIENTHSFALTRIDQIEENEDDEFEL
ncbi:MAG: PTS sugar transporter subunit IIA [Helcococcus sp.]|nr:PTS sugar transporter subunit IIA [Helcococcus sp.]